ncbi:MAG: AmmeMemoRadiSam system protein A [Poseidonibacter sp.]|uniref:AmmeMemoRadiSam system protein A n=1 Tax=Poseidonibacter sp. TaxID=2321188 RepID=UPI00359EBD1D
MNVENVLLEVARASILNEFNNSFKIDKQELQKEFSILQEKRACFVTITLNGKLRGCVGSLVAHRNLLDDVIQNAYNSAFSDLRFARLSYEEFKQINIEISVLTPAVKLEYKDTDDLKEKIKPFEHGIILECENKKATFLPQVWEQLPNFDDFFTQLSKKAGFSDSCLSLNPTIYTYTAIKIK